MRFITRREPKFVKIEPRRITEQRRFIPDARPITPHDGRGAFWYRIWLSMRLARAAQLPAAVGSWKLAATS